MFFLRFAACAVLLLGLSACLYSTEPLITADEADYPIADGTKFKPTRLDGDVPGTTMIVRRDGDLYIFEELKNDGEPDVFKGRLKEIAPDIFLSMGAQEDAGWLYGAYVRKGDSFVDYGPTCGVLEDLAKKEGRSLSEFGTSRTDNKSDCEFKTLDDVSKAMLFMIEAGFEPESRYTPIK